MSQPQEIKADAETFTDGVIQVTDLLIAAVGDESQLDIASMAFDSDDVVTPEFAATAKSVIAWVTSNCSRFVW